MGTQVHYKGFSPSYYSMRDLNEDANSSSWPLFYGDKTLPNGQYCNGFTSRTVTDAYPGYDKDILKQKMIEHEAIFRNQVVELHRLYRIQRDMMDEFKRKEMHKHRSSMEPSCSSSHLGPQVPSEDVRKWNITNLPLENSSYTRPSTSGTEIVNSPFSSSKGDCVQPDRVLMQNDYSSKACDVLEARPSKVRKKLFDLHLPANDYLDTEEGGQLRDNAGSLHPSYPANVDYVVTQESGTKLFLGGGAKGDRRKDTSTSNSCLRSSIGLADLNEPAQLDEAIDPVDFLGYGNNHKETRSINASAKSNSPFVALPWNSNCASPNESLSNRYDRSRGKDREWLTSAHETGNIKGSSVSLPRGLEEEKIPAASHQAPVMINKAYQAPGAYLVHHIKDGIWKDRTGHSLDMSHRNGEQSNYTQVGPFVTSKMASPFPCASSSEFSSSWPHSVSSWEKPNGSFTQRLSSLHTNSFFNSSAAVGKGSQSSQRQIGDYWQANGGSSRVRPGCASELPNRSVFYHGSSSGTKESPIHVPSGAFDSLSYIKGDRFTSEHSSNNAFENFLISSNNTDVKSAKGFNLNVLATSALSEEPPRQDVEFSNEKRERQDPVTVLPWLKAKANYKNEDVNTRIGGTSADSGFVQAYSNSPFCQSDPSALEHHHMKTAKEVVETPHVRKILGVPILDIPVASRNESSSSLVFASANLRSSPERKTIKQERSMVIDINVACDLSMLEPEEPYVVEQIATKKVMETKAMNIRNHFDLNSCITEDEEEPVSAVTDKASVKTILDIDLEAPVLMDNEQDDLPGEDDDKQHEASLQHTQEELLKTAAEAIVAISSFTHCTAIEEAKSDPSDDPLESLRWFVDVVSSCAAELDSTPSAKEITGKNNNMMVALAHSSFKEIDYFEAMTLQLTETKEEDYMPKPFVPEVQTVEDAGAASSLTNRPRRGNARRGRQRRDFQRDVLPGLSSLSRHEVTEDIQIFGGLMRATGHTWNSSLTRRNGTRNGGARGRRKKVVDTSTPVLTTTTTTSPLIYQLNNIEASLEDNKSLTGWGKTPRRPRRQRCPAGNPSPVLFT
ncbi:uncharacterized protein [Solanum tuberosum]|uniref:Uncharacterized protein n=1 Tax=Solanum tuberosum TaxID=4113 RepID=M1CRB2_SOLTU|nr:PREDICTED: uncharacterized protein LOC102605966 [Solanum tuberosum]XP_015164815.1 PREDICTED: uncharacterized protein LOC102605966 [Solanum tuberosum]XP_015164816.1 PREDICTED: uncharacterized protein LOC102605966 [Solanum tuberosum]XP_015164818.1 PREDICTED: uncharacterized protein LOC102605966 [Solanum tuberosum]XP_015164819.1 PREDICTED: uncharacterized protein LOC102605966 [Solanum tuberosum]